MWNFSQTENQAKELVRIGKKKLVLFALNVATLLTTHWGIIIIIIVIRKNGLFKIIPRDVRFLFFFFFLLYVHCTWGEGYNFSRLPHTNMPIASTHTHTPHHHNFFRICSTLEPVLFRWHSKIFVMANGAHNNLLIYCHLTSCTNYIFAHENHLSITLVRIVTIFRFSLFSFPQANSNFSLYLAMTFPNRCV